MPALNIDKKNPRLLFLGDLLYNYDVILPDIKEIGKHFQQAGYFTVLNMEAPLQSDTPIKKWINLYHEEKVIEVLKLLNVIAVNIANNHILDWGAKGLDRLLKSLNKNEILYFGGGRTLSEALAPTILNVDDKTIGLIGFGWREEMCIYATPTRAGVAPLKENVILRSVRQLREVVDVVVVSMHWGYEYERYPLPVHRKLAHSLIEQGVDLIIGHHPHIVQALEVYKNKNIFYSLGDFYFGTLRNRFETIVENASIRNLSKYGLGVVFDVKTQEISNIFIEIQKDQSKLCPNFHLTDLTNFRMSDYIQNYNNLRTSSRKPSLFPGLWHKLKNPVKLKLNYFKDIFVKILRPTLEQLGIYKNLRKRFKEFKKSW